MNWFLIVLSAIGAIVFVIAIRRSVEVLADTKRKHDEWKKRKQEVADMKESGEMHDWMNVPDGMGGEMHVCRKTGYCPTHDGFLSKEQLKLYEAKEMLKQQREEAQQAMLETLSSETGMSKETIEMIVERMKEAPERARAEYAKSIVSMISNVIDEEK